MKDNGNANLEAPVERAPVDATIVVAYPVTRERAKAPDDGLDNAINVGFGVYRS